MEASVLTERVDSLWLSMGWRTLPKVINSFLGLGRQGWSILVLLHLLRYSFFGSSAFLWSLIQTSLPIKGCCWSKRLAMSVTSLHWSHTYAQLLTTVVYRPKVSAVCCLSAVHRREQSEASRSIVESFHQQDKSIPQTATNTWEHKQEDRSD